MPISGSAQSCCSTASKDVALRARERADTCSTQSPTPALERAATSGDLFSSGVPVREIGALMRFTQCYRVFQCVLPLVTLVTLANPGS